MSRVVPDAAQRAAQAHLDRLAERLQREQRSRASLLGRLRRSGTRMAGRQGVYLWGGVGRGKTWLMDRFCARLDSIPRQRVHFHHLMREVHQRLGRLKKQADPLGYLAAQMARQYRLLCIDEMFVSDIADAMILGRMFDGLLSQGVALVMTSNLAPQSLYRDGLQRASFLPAIALLESRLEIVQVDGGIDYRLRHLQHAPLYLCGLTDESSESRLQSLYDDLTAQAAPGSTELAIHGHKLLARRRAGAVIWFDFATLCEGPRSQNDYIVLAGDFQALLLSGVPVFNKTRENAARRFIALVDELYDRGVKLALAAAASPEQLYQGEKLRAEFARTTSRLIEMQSTAYLAQVHRS